MKTFNPQIGDTIVTKEQGNFICANYEEYVEREGLICGVRETVQLLWLGISTMNVSRRVSYCRNHSSTKTRNQNYRRNLSGNPRSKFLKLGKRNVAYVVAYVVA